MPKMAFVPHTLGLCGTRVTAPYVYRPNIRTGNYDATFVREINAILEENLSLKSIKTGVYFELWQNMVHNLFTLSFGIAKLRANDSKFYSWFFS